MNQPPTFETFLRGVSFRPIEAKVIVKDLVEDDELQLERDGDNAYDPNAIRVVHPDSKEFLGFVAKETAVDIAPWIDDGWAFDCYVTGRVSTYVLMLRIEPREHIG